MLSTYPLHQEREAAWPIVAHPRRVSGLPPSTLCRVGWQGVTSVDTGAEVDLRAAAARLGISERTVRRRLHRGVRGGRAGASGRVSQERLNATSQNLLQQPRTGR